MLTEYEIETMMEIPSVREATIHLKKEFLKAEAPYLEIEDEDFYSLVMMAPTIGIALADGNITLFEEIALNKKARKLSKGGYFMKKDPVVYAMKFLTKNFDSWSERFFNVLKLTMIETCHIDEMAKEKLENTETVDYKEYKKVVLKSPYLLIRFIASFFLESDEDIINENHKIGQKEFSLMTDIGEKLGLSEVPVFQMFCLTFK